MEESLIWSVDLFKEGLSPLVSEFNSLFLSEVKDVIKNPNGDRKKSIKSLSTIDISNINSNALRVIEEIENELRRNALLCLNLYNISELEAKNFVEQRFYPGSLLSLMINDINFTIHQLVELKHGALIHLNCLENNSGLKGIFRGFIRGYTNPIDGLSHAFGQGSMQTELATNISSFNLLAIRVGFSIDSLSQRLLVVVLEKWNKELSYIL